MFTQGIAEMKKNGQKIHMVWYGICPQFSLEFVWWLPIFQIFNPSRKFGKIYNNHTIDTEFSTIQKFRAIPQTHNPNQKQPSPAIRETFRETPNLATQTQFSTNGSLAHWFNPSRMGAITAFMGAIIQTFTRTNQTAHNRFIS